MDPRRSPTRILGCHAKDERPQFSAHGFSPTDPPGSGEPFPIEVKTSSMPLHHRSRCDKYQGSLPSRPEPTPWSLGVQCQQLLTERQILGHEILARAERVDDPADEVTKRCEHAEILSECHSSAQLQVIDFRITPDILIRHRGNEPHLSCPGIKIWIVRACPTHSIWARRQAQERTQRRVCHPFAAALPLHYSRSGNC